MQVNNAPGKWPALPGVKQITWVLLVPVFLHGSFNFLLLLGTQVGGNIGALLMELVLLVDCAGLVLAREHVRHLSAVPEKDVHVLVSTGAVPPPELRCCLGICG